MLKQKFLIICSSLILIFSLLVSNLNAFSSEFASNSSSFSSSSSSQNDRDPTCIIADKIALEMEGWPMNYYKNPELDARYLLYEKASNTCYKAEAITSKLEKLQSTKVQITCTNINSLREQAKNNYDAKIAEEYYNAIKACSDDIGSNLAFSTSSSQQYSQQEIQTACENSKKLKDQGSSSYEEYMSVSSEYYLNQQICTSGNDPFLNSTNSASNSSTSSFYNTNSASSYSSSSKKAVTITSIEEKAPYCYDDVAAPYPPGCKRCTKNCYNTTGLLDNFCSTNSNNQIAQYIGCFVAGISFIIIALSVASFPVSIIYILVLYFNRSKKWKQALWLLVIPIGLIILSTIMFAISAFINNLTGNSYSNY